MNEPEKNEPMDGPRLIMTMIVAIPIAVVVYRYSAWFLDGVIRGMNS